MSGTLTDGIDYRDEDWPHGLMCAECNRVFHDGDRYSQRLESFQDGIPILLIICVACAVAGLAGGDAERARREVEHALQSGELSEEGGRGGRGGRGGVSPRSPRGGTGLAERENAVPAPWA